MSGGNWPKGTRLGALWDQWVRDPEAYERPPELEAALARRWEEMRGGMVSDQMSAEYAEPVLEELTEDGAGVIGEDLVFPVLLEARLGNARKARGMLVLEAANRCGIAPVTLRMIERGTLRPDSDTLDRLCTIYGIAVPQHEGGALVAGGAA